jgi:hypothetical protein
VKQAPAINQCTTGASQTVTLPTKPTQPTLILNDPDNVGSTLTDLTWTVSKNGSNVSRSNWDNIFDAAGTYNNYSVSGKCGNYPNNLTSTCTGNSTVNASSSSSCTSTFTIDNNSSATNWVNLCKGTIITLNNTLSKTCALICKGASAQCSDDLWFNTNESNINVPPNKTVTCPIPASSNPQCRYSNCY